MGDAMRAAGVGPEVEYKGRTYRFQPIRVQEIAKFEAWLQKGAWQAIYRQEEWMSPVEFQEQLRQTRLDIAAHQYSAGSDVFNKASLSGPGLKQVALISLQAGEGGDPAVDGELIGSLFADKPEEMAGALAGIGWIRRPDHVVQ